MFFLKSNNLNIFFILRKGDIVSIGKLEGNLFKPSKNTNIGEPMSITKENKKNLINEFFKK